MRQKLSCLLFAFLLLLPTAPVAAQDAQPAPIVLCGELAAEDCAILQASALAMQEVTASRFALTMTAEMAGIPEMQPDPLALSVEMAGALAMDDEALAAAQAMATLYRSEPGTDAPTPEMLRQLMVDLYAGLNYDLQMQLTLPPEVAAAMSQEAEVDFPSVLDFSVRMVDGMVYFDISDFKPMAPELEQVSADWLGFDMVGMMELSLADVPEGGTGALASSAAAGVFATQLVTLMQAYVAVERRENVALDGQEGAVFVTTPDLGQLLGSDEFQAMVTQMVALSAPEAENMSPEELAQGLSMLGLMAPVIFRDLTLQSTSTIGLDDSYLYASHLLLDWDLSSVMQMAAMSDDSLRDAVDAGLMPAIKFDFDATYSGYGEEIVIEAPKDVEIIPLDMLQPSDTSAVF